MFSGLIRNIGTIKDIRDDKIYIRTDILAHVGDSIAVNGICLSAIEILDDGFVANISQTTKSNIAKENLYKNAKLHLESALKVGDGIHGHFVQGHIDGIGKIIKIEHEMSQSIFSIEVAKSYIKYMIPKGSVAIDGVSLTIASVDKNTFRIALIPLSLKDTLFGGYQVGRRVNIESDILARSVIDSTKDDNMTWEQVDRINLGF